MGLRSFHLFFIIVSVILTAFFAAWAVGQYQTLHDVTYAITAAVSLASGVGLVIYAAAFLRKTKQL
jgi:hypothetical protein